MDKKIKFRRYETLFDKTSREQQDAIKNNVLLSGMADIFADALAIAVKKNHDYAGDVDPLANFRTFGWKGVIVRISDKWQRLVNFFKKQEFKCDDESFEDTIKDAINYLAIALVMYREEQGSPSAWRIEKGTGLMTEGQVHVGPMITRDHPLGEVPVRPEMLFDPMTGRSEQFSYKNDAKHHAKCTCYDCATGWAQQNLPLDK